jgi:3-methyladenine DNA glycosylase AlkD
LALHHKTATEKQFLDLLPLIERAAVDERNFVKKGVNWALRAIGERSAKLHAAAVRVARRLAKSESASCRWAGKDALRQLASRAAQSRLARRAK